MNLTYTIQLSPVDKKMALLWHQGKMILVLLGAWIGMHIINYFTSFYDYPYFGWGGWESVWNFWPAFAWSALLAFIAGDLSGLRSSERNLNFGLGVLTSVLAGVWEELAYRYVFICYAMIGIMFLNWLVGVGVGWVIVAILVIVALYLLSDGEEGSALIFGLLAILIGVLLYLYGGKVNIVYWFHDLIRSLIHITTFGKMDPVLYGVNNWLFVFGAVTANAWFRDGHTYQGWPGLIISWYMGMVLLYATVTYGLWTAVVIHVIYDIIIDVGHYIRSHL